VPDATLLQKLAELSARVAALEEENIRLPTDMPRDPSKNRAVLRPSRFLLTTPNLIRVRLLDRLNVKERRPRGLRL
jgi:hypothetical protein